MEQKNFPRGKENEKAKEIAAMCRDAEKIMNYCKNYNGSEKHKEILDKMISEAEELYSKRGIVPLSYGDDTTTFFQKLKKMIIWRYKVREALTQELNFLNNGIDIEKDILNRYKEIIQMTEVMDINQEKEWEKLQNLVDEKSVLSGPGTITYKNLVKDDMLDLLIQASKRK